MSMLKRSFWNSEEEEGSITGRGHVPRPAQPLLPSCTPSQRRTHRMEENREKWSPTGKRWESQEPPVTHPLGEPLAARPLSPWSQLTMVSRLLAAVPVQRPMILSMHFLWMAALHSLRVRDPGTGGGWEGTRRGRDCELAPLAQASPLHKATVLPNRPHPHPTEALGPES